MIPARGSVHPVYHEGHCVCVCVFDIACSPNLPMSPLDVHPFCVSRWRVCVCVCVCLTLPAPPTHHSVLPMFIAQYFNQRVATPTCVKIASDHCPMLHPPCGSRRTLCVCVFAIACSPNPPLHPPDVHSPLIYLVGRPRPHLSRLFPIIAQGSIHHVHHR